MKVIKPPTWLQSEDIEGPTLFAAGSIEMGVAEQWQERLAKALEPVPGTLFNPRRDDWDSTWVQSIEHPKFKQQVQWELDHIHTADVVSVYFAPDTKAPITLLELGLVARLRRAVACCPRAFYRRGNVEVVCDYFGVPLFDTWEPWVAEVERHLRWEAA